MMIKLKNKLKIFKTIQKYFVYFLIFLLSQSCDKKEGSFLTELPFENLVVITSGNGSHRGITAYDLGGNFVRSIGDFRLTGGLPRGTIYVGSERFLVVQDGPDKIDYLTFSGNQSPFYGSNFFSGATYDLAQDSRGNVYATESSNIEKFSPDGSRLPLSTGNAFIQGSVGACTISNARDLYITEDDILIIASFTNGNIIRVDVSTDTPVCLSSVNVGTQVHSAFLHSNGSLYYSRLTTDEIYRANPDGSGGVVVWNADTVLINNPTAMAELPDGTILVSSFSRHTIERIDENGNRVGSMPFISDAQSLSVQSIIVIGEDEE